jgi:orotate phosphoribosyltransferase
MTGFDKLDKGITDKKSHVILGLDPTPEEIDAAGGMGGIAPWAENLINKTAPYIVGIKPNEAFYAGTPETRAALAGIMKFTAEKHSDLVRILDVKHGDILATQTAWAEADIKNYRPDIVTLNPLMGGEDVVKPYLNADHNLCAYVLTATSNPGARSLQDLIVGGIRYYQEIARQAHSWDAERVGFVVGSTRPDAMWDIREIEKTFGFRPAPVLAPGFGRQGGNLEFVRVAGEQAVYPISSGLTKEKYLEGQTPAEAAKTWRNNINRELENIEDIPDTLQHVVDNMIEQKLIVVPTSLDMATWPFLKKGREKLEEAGVKLEGSGEAQQTQLRELLNNGTLDESDFTTIFMNIRNVLKDPETSRLMEFLYKKMIEESGARVDQVAMVAYGAIDTGVTVAGYLEKPRVILRKEHGTEPTHSDIVGDVKPGDRLIMVEDVTTSAGSLVKEAEFLRENCGADITDAFVFVKRTEDGEQNCREHGINLHYLLDMEQLKKMVANSKNVTPEIREMITRS